MVRRKAFTLGEVLVTLTIVGLLAVLVIPGLIKDVHNRARMPLLKKTVAEIQAVVSQDIAKHYTDSFDNLWVRKEPEKFLKVLNTVKCKGEGALVFYPSGGYKTLNGGNASVSSEYNASCVLKSGVGIGLFKTYNFGTSKPAALITIDLNGEDKPNVVGIDLFGVFIYGYEDSDNLVHFGDVSFYRGGTETAKLNPSYSTLKASCKGGNSGDCYAMAEISGFHPDYLNIEVSNE